MSEFSWSDDVRALRNWFLAYLLVWIVGLVLAINSAFDNLWILLLSIVPYIGSIVYAYRVQDELARTGIYKAGGWQVIVGALLLSPFFLGFWIPLRVLLKSSSVARDIHAGKVAPSAPRSVVEAQARGVPLASQPPPPPVPLAPELLADGVRRARSRGQFTMVVLGAVVATTLFVLVSDFAEYRLVLLMSHGVRPSQADIAATDSMNGMLGELQILASLVTIFAWLFWQYRAYDNLRLIGSRKTEYTPGWSVGYWFIPLLNLVRPHTIVTELWQRSATGNDSDMATAGSVGLVGAWWLCYLSGAMTGRLENSLVSAATQVSDYLWATKVGIASTALTLAGAVLAILVVRRIVGFQNAFVAGDVTADSLSPRL